MELLWLRRALKDRDAQLDYIAEENPEAAVSQGDEIDRQIDLLPSQPDMGRPGRKKGTRELVINRTPFILVYRVKARAKRIELLRLLHGAQQWPKGG
ncbi:MAG: type II toxin-antitoxin system RelE/ParE family toxin [Steroidobacteraceae bacterium]